MFVWKSFLNYYNFAKYSYRFCYIWSSCDFLGLSNHTQVIAIQANQVKSPSYIVQVKSQRALKSPNHWKWWLSSDSNHKSLESLWLGTNSAENPAANDLIKIKIPAANDITIMEEESPEQNKALVPKNLKNWRGRGREKYHKIIDLSK